MNESYKEMAERLACEAIRKSQADLNDSLFMPLPSNGTATSDAAAESMAPHAMTLRMRVLAAIVAAGELGMTREELCDYLAMNGDTLRPRCTELLRPKQGPAMAHERGDERMTTSGHAALILRATRYGYDMIRAVA